MDKVAVLKEIIESRRSIFPRDYSDEAIEPEILKEILSAAEFAPNHKKTKPWRLKIFKGEEKIQLGQKMAKIYKSTTAPQTFLEKKYLSISEKAAKADAIITISINFSGLVPQWEEIAATAMAVQNMYLTATAHNVGSYWSSPGLINHLDEFLELQDNQKCYGLFFLGNVKTV